MHKISLKIKLTLLNIAVLAMCSIAIAGSLNLSAIAMANTIEAQAAFPATSINTEQPPMSANPNQGPALSSNIPSATIETTASYARDLYLARSALALTVFVSIGAAVTYLLVKRETRGIEQLAQHLKSCTPDDLSKPFSTSLRNRETASLIEAFNAMSARTSEAIMAQNRFALAAAHEFKTPLAAMRTRLDVYGKHANPGIEDVNRLTATLSTQINRLSTLVSQLLELARSSTAKRNESVSIFAIAANVAEEAAFETGAKVLVSCSEPEEQVMVDRELIASAIRNALTNAIAYGQPPYRISCSQGRIVISNEGDPIPENERVALFEPFRRGRDPHSRTNGGYGLGLATTHAIMCAHGGSARFLPVKNGVSLELTFSTKCS